MKHTANSPSHGIKSLLAGLMATLFVVIGLLAARSDWHEDFHTSFLASEDGNSESPCDIPGTPDQNEADCAIDLYASGGIHFVPAITYQVLQRIELVEPLTTRAEVQLFSRSFLSPPGRAPPSSLFS